MQADIEGAVRIASLVAGFDWTWSIDDVHRFCAVAGWSYVESSGERGAAIRTGLDVAEPLARATYRRRWFERNLKPDQQVSQLVLCVTDYVDGTLPENHRSLTDAFAELADRLTTALGEPEVPSPGPEPEIRWSLPWSSTSRWRNTGASFAPAASVLFLRMDGQAVEMRIVNPTYQKWWDEYLSRDNDEEADGEYEDDEDMGDLPDRPRTWPEFSAALTLTLTSLPLEGILVIRKDDRAVAHIEPTWFGLTCRMLAGSVPSAQRSSGTERTAMTDSGWSIVEEDRVPEGWVRSLRWPASYREFEAMADAVVTALRDVYRVADPADLVVDAWDNSSENYPAITAFGVRS
ncbi:DUF6301 family protein [Nocardia sp. IFM 10818]